MTSFSSYLQALFISNLRFTLRETTPEKPKIVQCAEVGLISPVIIYQPNPISQNKDKIDVNLGCIVFTITYVHVT